MSDEDEEVHDLIQASMSNASKTKLNNTNGSAKSESEMQEIWLDSDSLEELVMVVEDIVNKRQLAEIASLQYTNSTLVIRARIVRYDENDSEEQQWEITLFDLTEIDEPIEHLK